MTFASIFIENDPAGLADAEQWLGTNIAHIQLHTGSADWRDWLTSQDWIASQFAGTGVDIMWSVPLIPWGASLAKAASGSYDQKYLAMAQQMLANDTGSSEIYVRVGWEFNGDGWNSSSAVGQPDNYIKAYQNFVDMFRSVSDRFVFEWCPNIGPNDMNPETAYPGDAYVDVIGIDMYYDVQWDSTDPQKAFDWFVNEPYGLQWQQDFAAAHGKPTAISEWGINSDAPEFVDLVNQWAEQNGMLYTNYWNSDQAFQGKLSDGQYAAAANEFKLLLADNFGLAGDVMSFLAVDPLNVDTATVPVLLNGTSGDDVLRGQSAADTLTGGDGNDTYYVDFAGEQIREWYHSGLGGYDRVYASVDYTLSANIEELTLTGTANLNGTGNENANHLIGNTGDNILDGGDNNDTLDGGAGDDLLLGGTGNDILNGDGGNDILDGGTGSDIMSGGAGNDSYYVDLSSDQVIEGISGGTDTVISQINYTLGANVENLVLAGAASTGSGNGLNNIITGNALINWLYGYAGDDTIYGGDGNDRIFGGDGNDRLYGEAGQNTIRGENGDDLLVAGNQGDNLDGGAGNDTLIGGDGADVLTGGTGSDMMDGGKGDDVYYVDAVSDQVTESYSGATGGQDRVFSSSSWSLPVNVEELWLTGSANISATGNNDDNRIVGNSGNNILTGLDGNDYLDGGAGDDYLNGGAGNDTLAARDGNDILNGGTGADLMYGGDGNDCYIVDSSSDTVVEYYHNGLGGIDTVQSSDHYTLGDNVENLTLIGSGNLRGTGNALDNIIQGNNANNVIDGGAGNDVLTGGGGNDIFRFATGFGHDRITDFSAGDSLDLSALLNSGVSLSVSSYGGNTYISAGANTIELTGIAPSHLQQTSTGFDYLI